MQAKSALRAALDDIKAQTHIILKLAFEIFMDVKYPISQPFLDVAAYLDSGAQSVDFSDPIQSAKTINTWVSIILSKILFLELYQQHVFVLKNVLLFWFSIQMF